MNKNIGNSGIVISIIGLILIIGFVFGITADTGGGNFAYLQLILVIIILLSVYFRMKKDRKKNNLTLILAILFCVLNIFYILLVDKPLHSDIEAVYQNIVTLILGYVLYVGGLSFQYVKK
ncbi:hypothetical protein A4S06_01065 [Erysipelotrichaceae bacterium MTC7]|nr:hypothetical protein A4S06_01065 [Erysipelotrichaceae bacterium MTC7]